jgi:hypothetical protein
LLLQRIWRSSGVQQDTLLQRSELQQREHERTDERTEDALHRKEHQHDWNSFPRIDKFSRLQNIECMRCR